MAFHPTTLLLALLAIVSLSACGGDDEEGDARGGGPAPNAPAPSSAPSPTGGDQGSENSATPIRISFGDTAVTGHLDDSATARDLIAQLPLALTFRDHNNVEKTAPLPTGLSTADAPEGHDPAAGDIGYWAPGGDLVFYYDDAAPYFPGIIRIGGIEAGLVAIESQRNDVDARIERAE